MNYDIDYFATPKVAILWMIGIRAVSRTPNATNLSSLKWHLVEDGCAVVLCVDSNCGHVTCIADLPHRMTEEEAMELEWLGDPAEGLAGMEPVGRA